jgi:hypothetical protein
MDNGKRAHGVCSDAVHRPDEKQILVPLVRGVDGLCLGQYRGVDGRRHAHCAHGAEKGEDVCFAHDARRAGAAVEDFSTVEYPAFRFWTAAAVHDGDAEALRRLDDARTKGR